MLEKCSDEPSDSDRREDSCCLLRLDSIYLVNISSSVADTRGDVSNNCRFRHEVTAGDQLIVPVDQLLNVIVHDSRGAVAADGQAAQRHHVCSSELSIVFVP